MRLQRLRPYWQRKARGISLIELMISIALGMAIVFLVLTFYQTVSSSGRTNQASQRMTEDAELAFQLIAQQFRQADYNPSRPRTETPTFNPLRIGNPPGGLPGMGVFSCARGFSNGTGSSADNIQSLTCNNTSTTTITYAFAVQFEADAYSPSVSGSTPADCRGFATALQSAQIGQPPTTATYYVIENRFYLTNKGLSCTGNGGTSTFESPSQPLVDNIESMDIRFGVSAPGSNLTPTATFAQGYLTADELGPASGTDISNVHTSLTALTPLQRWSLVRSARVCIVVKANRRTLFELEPNSTTNYGSYYGCDSETRINITDGFERRAYVRHFALRNRISTP